jgi:phosphomannomutase/phosphoglucomutase
MKTVDTQQTGAEKQKPGHGLKWYWAVALVVTALSTLSVGWLIHAQFHDLESELTNRQVLAGVEAIAGRLSEINRLRKQLLNTLANDPELVRLFQRQAEAQLHERENQLKRLIPDALHVRLLPAASNESDESLAAQLGYAYLEQLRQARKRVGVLPAEVHQFGTPQQHVSVVTSVRERGVGTAVGFIHVAFPLEELQAAIDSVGNYGGQVEVQQLAPNTERFRVAQSDETALASASPDGSVQVANSIWEVAYWSADKSGLGLHAGFYWSAVLGFIALLTGLTFVLTQQIKKALQQDQRSILTLVDGLLTGRPPKASRAHLMDMQSTLDVLHHQAKQHRVRVAQLQQKASPFGPGLESVGQAIAQDMTDTLSMAPISHEMVEISASLFRAYDIRGIVGQSLTVEVANLLGQSIGSEMFENGLQNVLVGRDGRDSSEALHSAVIAGLQATGRDVIDLGLVTTPILYYATHELHEDGCGVMVTGSHNAKEYNGLKIVMKRDSLTSEQIQELRRRIDGGQLLQGTGSFDSREIIPEYIERIISDVRLARPMKVVIDCGNGAAGVVAPELFRQLGGEVIELFCEVDGSFPNHHPDPNQPGNMEALQRTVLENQADIGFAFDGDGDRLGVVDSAGKLIWPDRLLMYLAIDVLTREPGGDIIYDVKCTRHLANVVLSHGGRPLMWKSGHSMLKAKLKETHALLAGEFSGHIIFSERWYGFDDGLYAAVRLLETLALEDRDSAEVFAELPDSLATPEYKLPLPEGQSEKLMEALEKQPDIPAARIVKIDGLRIEFEQGWGLVRASHTSPALLFRFESDSPKGLAQVQEVFRELFAKVDTTLKLPF